MNNKRKFEEVSSEFVSQQRSDVISQRIEQPTQQEASSTSSNPPQQSTDARNSTVSVGTIAEQQQQRQQASSIEQETPTKQSIEFQELQLARRNLPIFEYRQSIIDAVKNNQVVVVIAETGSGKTTQIAQFLYEDASLVADGKLIGVTQPRRVAAVSVARRVASEMGVDVGGKVGYSVRFSGIDTFRSHFNIECATNNNVFRK
jgi:HrpA-like RNA helicase